MPPDAECLLVASARSDPRLKSGRLFVPESEQAAWRAGRARKAIQPVRMPLGRMLAATPLPGYARAQESSTRNRVLPVTISTLMPAPMLAQLGARLAERLQALADVRDRVAGILLVLQGQAVLEPDLAQCLQ